MKKMKKSKSNYGVTAHGRSVYSFQFDYISFTPVNENQNQNQNQKIKSQKGNENEMSKIKINFYIVINV